MNIEPHNGTETIESAPLKSKPISKPSAVEKLLKRPRGATIAEMMTATGWKNHSVRAFLSGSRKRGEQLSKEVRNSGEASYRLAKGEGASTEVAAPIDG